MNERGLDPDGTIAREGALELVPAAFSPVVDAARAHIRQTFGSARLHSAYLYGSIPRGTAPPTGVLARETNGDLALLLPRWRTRAA